MSDKSAKRQVSGRFLRSLGAIVVASASLRRIEKRMNDRLALQSASTPSAASMTPASANAHDSHDSPAAWLDQCGTLLDQADRVVDASPDLRAGRGSGEYVEVRAEGGVIVPADAEYLDKLRQRMIRHGHQAELIIRNSAAAEGGTGRSVR